MNRARDQAWGRWAELLAAWSLRLRGYRVIAVPKRQDPLVALLDIRLVYARREP